MPPAAAPPSEATGRRATAGCTPDRTGIADTFADTFASGSPHAAPGAPPPAAPPGDPGAWHSVCACSECGVVAPTAPDGSFGSDPGRYCRVCWLSFDGEAEPAGGLPPQGDLCGITPTWLPCDMCGGAAPLRANTDPADLGRYCRGCWLQYSGPGAPAGGLPPPGPGGAPDGAPAGGLTREPSVLQPAPGFEMGDDIDFIIRLTRPDEPLGIAYERREGGALYISHVVDGGPVDRALIVPPTVVLALDGMPVFEAEDFRAALQRVRAAGRTEITLTTSPGTPRAARHMTRRTQLQNAVRLAEQDDKIEEQQLLASPEYVEWLHRRAGEKRRAARPPPPGPPPLPPLRRRTGPISVRYAADPAAQGGSPPRDAGPTREERVALGAWLSPQRGMRSGLRPFEQAPPDRGVSPPPRLVCMAPRDLSEVPGVATQWRFDKDGRARTRHGFAARYGRERGPEEWAAAPRTLAPERPPPPGPESGLLTTDGKVLRHLMQRRRDDEPQRMAAAIADSHGRGRAAPHVW